MATVLSYSTRRTLFAVGKIAARSAAVVARKRRGVTCSRTVRGIGDVRRYNRAASDAE